MILPDTQSKVERTQGVSVSTTCRNMHVGSILWKRLNLEKRPSMPLVETSFPSGLNLENWPLVWMTVWWWSLDGCLGMTY
eukprot:6103131-Amphidinium_carterae.1